MIIVMKPNAADESIQSIIRYIEEIGLQAHLSPGTQVTILGLVGGISKIADEKKISYASV